MVAWRGYCRLFIFIIAESQETAEYISQTQWRTFGMGWKGESIAKIIDAVFT